MSSSSDSQQIFGAGSFIGFATAVKAINSGYRVRGVFWPRSHAHPQHIADCLSASRVDHFEYCMGTDPLVQGLAGFDRAIEGATYIIYTPSEAIFDVRSIATAPQYRRIYAHVALAQQPYGISSNRQP